MSLRPDSNGYPDICDHAGLVCDTADNARRWLVTGIQDVAHYLAAILNFGSRPTSHKVDGVTAISRAWPKYGDRKWNRGVISHR